MLAFSFVTKEIEHQQTQVWVLCSGLFYGELKRHVGVGAADPFNSWLLLLM